MFKNFQILFALALILVLAASPTFAQDKSAEITIQWDVHHTADAGVAGLPPSVANGWADTDDYPVNVAGHHYFGIPNGYDDTVIKTLHLYLNGNIGVLDLAYVNAIGYDGSNIPVSTIMLNRIRATATGVLVEIVFEPQPEWETVELNFLNPVEITSATAWTHCQESYHPVPSLSTWGLIALIVLVLGAGVVMARRKAANPAV